MLLFLITLHTFRPELYVCVCKKLHFCFSALWIHILHVMSPVFALLPCSSTQLQKMSPDNCVIKSSDDAAILGLMHKNSTPSEKEKWCDKSHLARSVEKMEELLIPEVKACVYPSWIHHTRQFLQETWSYADRTPTQEGHTETVCSWFQDTGRFMEQLGPGEHRRIHFFSLTSLCSWILLYRQSGRWQSSVAPAWVVFYGMQINVPLTELTYVHQTLVEVDWMSSLM